MLLTYNPLDGSAGVNSALITGIFSLIIACITAIWSVVSFFLNRRKFEKELNLKRQEIENILFSQLFLIRNNYSEKLLQKRMQIYPELIKITQELGKDKGQDKMELRKKHEEAFVKLKKWQMDTGGSLYFSKKSIDSFFKLIDTLDTKNLDPDLVFDKAKIDAIRKKRNIFRKDLHSDLYILQQNEDYLKLGLDKFNKII